MNLTAVIPAVAQRLYYSTYQVKLPNVFLKKCESQAVKSHNGCCTIKITKKQLYHKKNQYSFQATFRLLYFVPHFAILPVFSMQKG